MAPFIATSAEFAPMRRDPRFQRLLVDRYRLDRELGAGGMATVYLAHDLKHDRDIAIPKVNPRPAGPVSPR